MHRRHTAINIPIEIVRTVVAIADTGSFTKAGDKLGLSQPAISAQIKRLQLLVAGPVFERVTGGVVLTGRGKMILPHARRLLESNDQILLMGGAAREPLPVRLGLSKIYAEQFLPEFDREKQGDVHIYCDMSDDIAKGLTDGYIDIGCLQDPPRESGEVLVQWQEEYVWTRSSGFTLSPGAPIPLVSWPGCASDQVGVDALKARGLSYRIAFASGDFQCRRAAALAGLGILCSPARIADRSLTIARDYYLPPLPAKPAAICVRDGFDIATAKPLMDLLLEIAGTAACPQRPKVVRSAAG